MLVRESAGIIKRWFQPFRKDHPKQPCGSVRVCMSKNHPPTMAFNSGYHPQVKNLFPGLLLAGGVLLSVAAGYAHDIHQYLIPSPQRLTLGSDDCAGFTLEETRKISSTLDPLRLAAFTGVLTTELPRHRNILLELKLDTALAGEQAYTLNIQPGRITIAGRDHAALFYGKQTLLQVLDYALAEKKPLPCLWIEDWPDFSKRGFMLDISRDKVPTMETLYKLIDLLASWKINELQLYTEHTFAYKKHKTVWEHASPVTPEEIQLLDKYCAERFIDLVPNQNSFGHMENWLKHEEYTHLADCPDDCKTRWGMSKRHGLDPTNPQSLQLMTELYTELLPNFSSRYFNIGCDETFEMCCGRSREACEQSGPGEVYLRYLRQLNAEVNKLGKQCQFWGDIVLMHPELIPEIPVNMCALVWGYGPAHPFDKQLPAFKNAGLGFYVCPGTSAWCSLIGKNQAAFENLKNAAVQGRLHGAKGYLNTNWGDYGHWQPLSVEYPAIMTGAGYAWHYDSSALDRLEFQLNHYVFDDESGNTAKAVLKLGNAYLKTGIPNGNANAFHLLLARYDTPLQNHHQCKELDTAGLAAAEREIMAALEILKNAHPGCNDARIVKAETEQAARLALHSIHLGMARLNSPDFATKNISPHEKKMLIAELEPLIARHKKLWVVRNRPGGLSDSAGKLEKLLDYYSSTD